MDLSVLLVDDPPEKDTYTVTVETKLTGIRGFKLETLTDPSLPGNGPGRGDAQRPNFVLNTFAVRAAPTGEHGAAKAVKLTNARADFSQERYDVAGAIDDDPRTAWAIYPQFHRPHWATFETTEPIGHAEGIILTFTLVQEFGKGRTIGRLRLSALTGEPGAKTLPEQVVAALQTPKAKRTAAQRKLLLDYRLEQDEAGTHLKGQRTQADSALNSLRPAVTLTMQELPQPRKTTIFVRGNFRDPGRAVTPGAPAVLHPLPDGPPNRLTLARWLVSRDNPLAARVTVNRWWAELFGHGLVSTIEDFGVQGEPPTHPELLDWLAVEFMDGGWSMKHILKQVVLSSTYRQSSRLTPALQARDDQNHLYARGPRFRMDAEMIRDNALAVAGLLSAKQFGPPVRPYQPEGLWTKIGGEKVEYVVSPGPDRYRRGVYVVWKRSAPYPSFMNFDANAAPGLHGEAVALEHAAAGPDPAQRPRLRRGGNGPGPPHRHGDAGSGRRAAHPARVPALPGAGAQGDGGADAAQALRNAEPGRSARTCRPSRTCSPASRRLPACAGGVCRLVCRGDGAVEPRRDDHQGVTARDFGVRRFVAAFFCFWSFLECGALSPLSLVFLPLRRKNKKESGGKAPHSKSGARCWRRGLRPKTTKAKDVHHEPLRQPPAERHAPRVFQRGGLGLGAMALGTLLRESAGAAESRAATCWLSAPAQFAARARSVIYLHMIGAPSQLDLFDHKPALRSTTVRRCPEELTQGRRFAFIGGATDAGRLAVQVRPARQERPGDVGTAAAPGRRRRRHRPSSDRCTPRRSITARRRCSCTPASAAAGGRASGRGSLMGWVPRISDLPAYVVLLSGPLGGAGTCLWSSGFLPSVYQGIQFRSGGDPVLFLSNPPGQHQADRRRVLDAVDELNREQLAGSRRPRDRHAHQPVRDGLPHANVGAGADGHDQASRRPR